MLGKASVLDLAHPPVFVLPGVLTLRLPMLEKVAPYAFMLPCCAGSDGIQQVQDGHLFVLKPSSLPCLSAGTWTWTFVYWVVFWPLVCQVLPKLSGPLHVLAIVAEREVLVSQCGKCSMHQRLLPTVIQAEQEQRRVAQAFQEVCGMLFHIQVWSFTFRMHDLNPMHEASECYSRN